MIESFAIHTAVLVGLVVTWLWTERLGGVFAGFAVPGYLGAIALVAPASAATLVIEAILTYAIVWILGEGLARLGAWSRVFGRERFLLFIVVSVPVRLVVEGLAAGGLQVLLGPWLPDGAGDGFFSVGLVLVPLLANTFWKPGLVRGLAQVGGMTGATIALLTLVVMPLTGLQFSSFFLSFEGIALAFLAVPKVYIILLCTAAVATWTAERFGFNAGGLLVPALLGLLVLEPTKLVTTLVEIVALTLLYRGVTALPLVRGLELAGPRRLVAMYVMAWGLKLAFAWLGQLYEIPVATWNLYGFGYLLSSLVAVRCLDLRPMGRVLLPLGFNLGAGAGIGLVASISLGWTLPDRGADRVQPTPHGPEPVARAVLLAAGEVREDPAAPQSTIAILQGLPAVIADPDARPDRVQVEPLIGPQGTCVEVGPADPRMPGAWAWWCGGEGPVWVVPAGRTDPDAVWLAAWALSEGAASGVILAGVDGGTAPLWAERAVRAASRSLPVDRPIVVVERGADGEGSRVIPAGPTGPSVRLPGDVAPVPLAFEAQAVEARAWWEALRAGDAVLQVDVAEVESRMPPAPIQTPDLASRSDRSAPDVDARAAWLGRLAMTRVDEAEAGEPAPPGLAWAAWQLGVRAGTVEGPTSGWLLVEEDAVRGLGALLLRPGARSDLLTLAPRAPDEEGTARVAIALAQRLDARATWWARRGLRGLERRLGERLDTADAAPALLREVLRPEPWTLGRALAVRRMTSSVPGDVGVMLVEGGEGIGAADPDLAAVRTQLDAVYPGWQRARGTDLEPPALVARQPLRYLEALTDQGVGTVWIRPSLLAEVQGVSDRQELERWYGLLGVPADPASGRLRIGERVDDDEALALLLAHLEAPSVESVSALVERGQVTLVPGELRMGVALYLEDRVCLARAGAPPRPGPDTLSGCWRRP